MGLACSTIIVHLERLGSRGLVLRERKSGGGLGRPIDVE